MAIHPECRVEQTTGILGKIATSWLIVAIRPRKEPSIRAKRARSCLGLLSTRRLEKGQAYMASTVSLVLGDEARFRHGASEREADNELATLLDQRSRAWKHANAGLASVLLPSRKLIEARSSGLGWKIGPFCAPHKVSHYVIRSSAAESRPSR